MQREKIDTMLGAYRENAARAQHLSVRIQALTAMAEEYKAHATDNLTRITPAYSLTPGGGPVSSKVERLAIMLADGDSPAEIKEIMLDIEAAAAELKEVQTACEFVEAWLQGLQARERYVLTTHIIDGQVWREVITGFNSEFGVIYSRTGLKQILTRALDKIYRIAG